MMPRKEEKPDFPYWLLLLIGAGLWVSYEILVDPNYRKVLLALVKGIWITLGVSVVAFGGACLLGLILAVMGLSHNLVLRQIARLYIEVMRGIPILVLLLYVSFALTPLVIAGLGWLMSQFGLEPIRTRDVPLLWRAVAALMLAYSAFLAEVFRAGIQSVELGQSEAANALGLSPWQSFRLVIFPQALRNILPPLGNDFIAMLKDSSLVAVLGITDVAQLAKVTAAGNFRYFETYNVAALIYLVMTIGLSLILRRFEARMRARDRQPKG